MWSKLAAAVTMLAGLTGISSGLEPWGYSESRLGQVGPSHWGAFYPQCNGTRQSPVNIPFQGVNVRIVNRPPGRVPLEFLGNCDDFTLRTLDDVYRWEARETCFVQQPNGKRYKLLQFHVHTQSEHMINGRQFNGEIHFVHQDISGNGLLVVGLLLSAQGTVSPNPWIENVWRTMMFGKENVPMAVNVRISYTEVLKKAIQAGRVLNYKGSLTTPPCSEIVDWWVLTSPLTINLPQFMRLDVKIRERPSSSERGDNNRPIQKLGNRLVFNF